MMRSLSLFILLLFLFTAACGMQHPVQTAIHQYKTQTPPEYYNQLRPASAAEEPTESTIPETKSDRSHIVLIGVLAGVVAVAGAVVPIVLLNK